jgi:MoaA/NifB/PqqE/SkfB family radical SAM enzyme
MNFTCNKPFTRLEFFNYGYNKVDKIVAMPCCGSWLNIVRPPIINKKEDIIDVWNGEFICRLRQSILDSSYRFCNKLCPFLIIQQNQTKIDIETKTSPKILAYSIDKSCNLKCITCRKEFIYNDNSHLDQFLSYVDENTEILEFNGSGEPLFQKDMLKFLRYQKLNKKINLITNGLLLDENMWNSFSTNTKQNINRISVSIDANTKETYSKIRIGGNYNQLMSNLIFINSLRETGIIQEFEFNFVVQKQNVHEMTNFCKFAQNFHLDNLLFQTVNNWGRFDYKELIPDNEELNRQINMLKQVRECLTFRLLTNFNV